MAKQLKIIMAQLNLLVGDIGGNTNMVIEAAKRGYSHFGADAIVFPELALTGYPPEDLLLRPGLYDRVKKGIDAIKQDVTGITVIIGYPERIEGCVYNSVAVIKDGEIVGNYRKQCLPNYGVFDEKRYFHPGEDSCVVSINGVFAGITICEDIWFSGPAVQAVKDGARLIINVNASPFDVCKQRERLDTVVQRVAEVNTPIMYVNLVGGQDELVFDGGSFIVDEQGKVCQIAPSFQSGLYLAEFSRQGDKLVIDETVLAKPQKEIESVYQALVLGVRDYIEKNKFPGAIIGLSGGIDSAITLAIAVDAMGSQRVEAVMMPSPYTSELSLKDAKHEAGLLGVEYHVLSIEPVYNMFLETLKDEFAGVEADTAEENIQARCRGVLLMAISNKKNKIVLTTGNKSEMAVGYATLYGDMAGGFNVLKDVPKTLVYKLADYRNTLSAVIPESVIHRAPSAELAPDQKDSDSLPEYGELDGILELYVEQEKCMDDIVAAGFPRSTVNRVILMVDRNEYKRRQAAPGVRITRRAFGRDRRYPITSGFNK